MNRSTSDADLSSAAQQATCGTAGMRRRDAAECVGTKAARWCAPVTGSHETTKHQEERGCRCRWRIRIPGNGIRSRLRSDRATSDDRARGVDGAARQMEKTERWSKEQSQQMELTEQANRGREEAESAVGTMMQSGRRT